MLKSDFAALIEQNIDAAAQAILAKGNISDEVALGKLGFYLALRRELQGKRSPADLGLLGAINDTLQALGIVQGQGTFLSDLETA